MKERPILFSAPMVRALLAGTKTQTRRVISAKTWRAAGAADHAQRIECAAGAWQYADNDGWHDMRAPQSPYGQPRDRLWVREAWGRDPDGGACYRADCTVGLNSKNYADQLEHDRLVGERWARWKPSIYMPRRQSRITLEITNVRVERLNDINDGGALAEGIYPTREGLYMSSAQRAYAELWDQINGPGSWAANPWVWVVEFKRVPLPTSECTS